jgi:acid phosphatase (class A)
MHRSCYLFVSLIAAALAVSSAAKAGDAFYLNPAELDLIHVLAPPPVADSPAEKIDLQAVLAAVKSRTEAEIKRVQADDLKIVFRFADVMGPNFRPESLPFATQFFQHVYEDGKAATVAAKAYFKRQRPFVVDPDIKIIVVQAPDFSYPSNHSTFAYEAGILLAAMVPEKAAAIFERAADYAHNRVVAGVHFPTDIEAGRISGSVIDNSLLHDAHFLTDFERAKSEVRGALGLNTANNREMENAANQSALLRSLPSSVPGPKRTRSNSDLESAFGGKADIAN